MPTHFRSTMWMFPLIYTSASCAEKSLIDGSVKGQYAANGMLQKTDLCGEVWNFHSSGHLDIEKCIGRIREHVYWLGITAEIKDAVSNSSIFLDEYNHQLDEQIIHHEIPELTWIKLAQTSLNFTHKKLYDR